MRAAYQMGRRSQWQLLLNQQEPGQLSRLLRYHDAVLQERNREFENFQLSLNKLEAVEGKILANVNSLKIKREALQKQHNRLVRQRSDRKNTLARLRGLIKNKDQQLKQQQAQRKELERVIATASRIAGGIGFDQHHTSFKKRKGKLSWPVKGKIHNRYGAIRNGSLRWDGVLIKSSTGTAVKAIHSGRVLFADWLPGQGLLLIVDHGDSYMSLYAHNEMLLKEPGEWVEGGETIARSGSSGGQQIAGVYFEIRYKGKPTNPNNWCRRG